MPVLMNPFAADGYSLAEMTRAISLIPNALRAGECSLGLFGTEPLAQRTALVESMEGELRCCRRVRSAHPRPWGPATSPGAFIRHAAYPAQRCLTARRGHGHSRLWFGLG